MAASRRSSVPPHLAEASRWEMALDPLVEPDDAVGDEDQLREELLVHGVPPPEADRLATYLESDARPSWWPNGVLQNSLPVSSRHRAFVESAGNAWRSSGSENGARFALLTALIEFGAILDADGKPLEDEGHGGRSTRAAVVRHLLPTF